MPAKPTRRPACVVAGLGKSYDGVPVLDNVSFSVAPGEVLALLGANGSGKTTTLRCVAGLLDPTAGTVEVGGVAVRAGTDQPDVRRSLSVVPDEPALYDDLTVWEHGHFTAGAWGVAGWEDTFDALLGRLGLLERADDMPVRFSRGMRQKVGLALAFLHPATLYVVDEPFSGLDATGRAVFVELLAEAQAGGAGVLLATHALGRAVELSRRAVLLDGGRVSREGPPRELSALLGAEEV